jgi:hypothetical protein
MVRVCMTHNKSLSEMFVLLDEHEGTAKQHSLQLDAGRPVKYVQFILVQFMDVVVVPQVKPSILVLTGLHRPCPSFILYCVS